MHPSLALRPVASIEEPTGFSKTTPLIVSAEWIFNVKYITCI